MIQILTTGGTIEGLEYEKLKDAPSKSPVTLSSHLNKLKKIPKYTIKEVFSKDSRFINRRDLNLLLREIQFSKVNKILVTHGTFTMVETAQYIGQLNLSKTVVFTGAFIHGTSPKTDAIVNLDFAIKSLENLEFGTYIAIQDTIFHHDNVVKSLDKNRFETFTKW